MPIFLIFFPAEKVIIISVGVIWLLGLIDDLEPIRPRTKLIVQTTVATFLVLSDWRLGWFDNLVIDIPLSLLWIIGITNAFNIIDNMDGLVVGITIIILLFLGNQPVLLGLALGFLIFNFPPAKVFMGDCGALFFGLNLACLTMGLGPEAILLLLVPIADTTFVTVRRLLRKRSPARGGLDHLSHELAKGLHSQLAAVAVLWMFGILGGVLFLWS